MREQSVLMGNTLYLTTVCHCCDNDIDLRVNLAEYIATAERRGELRACQLLVDLETERITQAAKGLPHADEIVAGVRSAAVHQATRLRRRLARLRRRP